MQRYRGGEEHTRDEGYWGKGGGGVLKKSQNSTRTIVRHGDGSRPRPSAHQCLLALPGCNDNSYLPAYSSITRCGQLPASREGWLAGRPSFGLLSHDAPTPLAPPLHTHSNPTTKLPRRRNPAVISHFW